MAVTQENVATATNPAHTDVRARLGELGWSTGFAGGCEAREWWWDHRTNSYLCVALPTDTTEDKRILVCWWPTADDDYNATTMPQVVALRLGAGRM